MARRRGAHTSSDVEHYWPQIDGLRAIAIGLVVGFHAGLPGFSGGFVGVDVFFVLSGYLITGLLARELERTGRIDLVDFYARRARRLLPALTLVLAVTLIAGNVLLLPIGEQQALAKSAIAAALFVTNIYFWRARSDYFAESADETPLLHLWTLSVEEQFYIFWPLLMIAVAALAARSAPTRRSQLLAGVLLVTTLTSFLACWFLTPSRLTLAFYNVPFRAWEFGVGALLALAPPFAQSVRAALFGLASTIGGLAAIVLASAAFDRGTIFPGANAALPVLGTGAVLLGLRLAPGTLPARLLASLPLVLTGKLSYSWYLWHWPLLALARATELGETSLLANLGIVAVALVLSALTFMLVEDPIRRQKPGPFARSGPAVLAGLVLMLVTTMGAGLLWQAGDSRLQASPVYRAVGLALEQKADVPSECSSFQYMFAGLPPAAACTLGLAAGGPIHVLWGDSHAFHFIPALADLAVATSSRLLPRIAGACKPNMSVVATDLADRERQGAQNCVAHNRAVLSELASLRAADAKSVILAARWPVPSQLQSGLGDWEGELARVIAAIRLLDLEVVLLADVPRPRGNSPHCIARLGAAACARPRAAVDAERAATLAGLKRLAAGTPGVRLIDLIDTFCSATTCNVVHDGIVLYRDDSHLSVAGSRALAARLQHSLSLTGANN